MYIKIIDISVEIIDIYISVEIINLVTSHLSQLSVIKYPWK